MKTQHLEPQTVHEYLRGQLSDSDLLKADDHIALCSQCRESLLNASDASSSVQALKLELSEAGRELTHLSFDEQIMPYIDGRLNALDIEILESHLQVCEECSTEIQDLRGFRETLGRSDRAATHWFGGRAVPLLTAAAATLILIIGSLLWRVLPPKTTTAGDSEGQNHQARQPVPLPTASSTTDSQLVASLRDEGGLISLHQDGTLIGLKVDQVGWIDSIRSTLRQRSVQTPVVLAQLRSRPETLLGPERKANLLTVLSPLNVVVDDRPVFRWQGGPQGANYVVEVFDERFRRVVASNPLGGTFWTMDRPLRRSKVYSWQVTASAGKQSEIAPAPPAPQARFKVMSAKDAQEIEKAKAVRPVSHLLLGVVYAEKGLLEEAEAEFKKIADANPKSELARALLDSVQRWRRGG